ncbi:hypothetical protein [uncultured Clostridium sp.]|uniref:hypothetical protein n=1 Tax=uncultured Clostridium sp. TaxID=59620 RepID=UPI00260651A5|nr:hypothetical protein [uncultured Clostridium sp.]
MEEKEFTCSICGKQFYGYGNNAQPINNGRCCNECNNNVVLPKRLENIFGRKEK